ncbi:MAG: hypothetical protein MZW92_25350 [Comamonadaceae bacterium]|nr:hypothetical protein [Comamonadaceae bacterium]
MQWATRVNEAYRTLKQPAEPGAVPARDCTAWTPRHESNTAMPAEFLMEQMEWREGGGRSRGRRRMSASWRACRSGCGRRHRCPVRADFGEGAGVLCPSYQVNLSNT